MIDSTHFDVVARLRDLVVFLRSSRVPVVGLPGEAELRFALAAEDAADEITRLNAECAASMAEIANLRGDLDRLRTLLSSSRGEQGWRTIDSAPKDGTHIIGNTQWGAREIWWHKDTYEGEYWTDEGDSEPEPTGWIPMPGSVPTSLAGQVPDDWDRIIATLREFSSLRAADGDHWEADAAERAAQEIERIPPVSRPALCNPNRNAQR